MELACAAIIHVNPPPWHARTASLREFSTALILLLIICLPIHEAAAYKLAAVPPVPADEVEALLQFKSYLSIPSQGLLKGWDANNTHTICTSWVGVTCHENQHIQAVNITNLGLAGSLAPHLGNLSSLVFLVLHTNSLTGSIPPQLSRLSSLRDLNLNHNSLTGHIPSSLSELSSLLILNLEDNRLTGHIPQAILTNCTFLQSLSLWGNILTGSIPTLTSCPHLQYLLLYSNNLTGEIPRSLGNHTHLRAIDVSLNDLTGLIPTEIGSLPELQDLFLMGNYFTGTIPPSVANCTNLNYFFIHHNRLTGVIPTEVANLQKLQYMDCSYNHISGGLQTLGSSNLTTLIELTLSSNELTGSIPTVLGRLQNLQYLELESNSFSNHIPWESLINCSSLFHLSLSNNYLDGLIPSMLVSFRNLQEIFLSHNLLEGALPNFAGSATWQVVDFSYNRLNGSLPASFARVLSVVTQLFLNNNHFLGSLPSWLGTLVAVQDLGLEYNHFSGRIQETLGLCVQLIRCNLSNNHLSGGIPLSLGQLNRTLEALDISNNKLTGALPSFLESFHRLRFLNVSFNNFTGAIPLHGVFTHLNVSLLRGNPGLCGPIIHKPCINHSEPHHHKHHLHQKVVLFICGIILAIACLILVVWAIIHYKFAAPRDVKCLRPEVTRYTAEELAEATENYSDGNLVGQGGFSMVYKGVVSDGKFVAVKKFKEVCSRDALLQEVQILSKLRHRNLVRVLGCVLNLEVNALVLEYMSNGSLENYLYHQNEPHGLGWTVLTKLMVGIADALTYLHHDYGIPIIHGDVKPSNILLDADLEAHLGDFGLAKHVKEDALSMSSNFKGSIGYMAPEYAYAARITTKVDVFSFGVVVLEMLTGRKPTDQLDGSASLHEWVRDRLDHGAALQELLQASLLNCETSLGVLNENIVLQLLRMGVVCTKHHPHDRPTMREIRAYLFDNKGDIVINSSA